MEQADRTNKPSKTSLLQVKSGAIKIVAACALSTLALASFSAHAGGNPDVRWSVTIGSPIPVVVYPAPQVIYQPAPVVYQQPAPVVVYPQPQVVYQQPARVYYPAPPVVYQPRPVVYPQPVYYGPGYYGPGYYGQRGHWRHGHGHGQEHGGRAGFSLRVAG